MTNLRTMLQRGIIWSFYPELSHHTPPGTPAHANTAAAFVVCSMAIIAFCWRAKLYRMHDFVRIATYSVYIGGLFAYGFLNKRTHFYADTPPVAEGPLHPSPSILVK